MADGGCQEVALRERRSLVGLDGWEKEVSKKSESPDVRWWRELEWLKMESLLR